MNRSNKHWLFALMVLLLSANAAVAATEFGPIYDEIDYGDPDPDGAPGHVPYRMLADDFQWKAGDPITGIRVWGLLGGEPHVYEMRLTLFAEVSDGAGPGEVIHTWSYGARDWPALQGGHEFLFDEDSGYTPGADGRYWLALAYADCSLDANQSDEISKNDLWLFRRGVVPMPVWQMAWDAGRDLGGSWAMEARADAIGHSTRCLGFEDPGLIWTTLSGTNLAFEVLPEPATLMLLGVGGMVLRRRRA